MANTNLQQEYKINETAGAWFGWIGIILAVIGFWWQPILLPIVGLVLGVLAILSPKKTVGWISVIVGAVALIVGLV